MNVLITVRSSSGFSRFCHHQIIEKSLNYHSCKRAAATNAGTATIDVHPERLQFRSCSAIRPVHELEFLALLQQPPDALRRGQQANLPLGAVVVAIGIPSCIAKARSAPDIPRKFTLGY